MHWEFDAKAPAKKIHSQNSDLKDAIESISRPLRLCVKIFCPREIQSLLTWTVTRQEFPQAPAIFADE
jgi:hypothetical protein